VFVIRIFIRLINFYIR